MCTGPPPAWLFSECVVTSSGYIGRMSFPFPSIRREASVNCGTPDNGRCKQTPCKGENRHMNFADVEECARGAGSGEAIPHSPLPLWRDVPTELTLWLHLPAVTSGLHRVAHTRNRVGSGGPAAEIEMSADVGSHEGCGVCPISPPHFQGIAGLGGCVWAWRAPPSSSPQFPHVPVCL